MSETNTRDGMHQRRVKLSDGRYLIFYNFDAPHASSADAAERESLPEPEARPEAEEERRV